VHRARSTYQKLEHAQDLLGRAVPSGDLAQVLDRALDALIAKLERREAGQRKAEVADLRPAGAAQGDC
jgi:hypothetical protein